MKFLLDMGLSKKTLSFLKNKGFEAEHLSDLGLQRLEDKDIVIKAKKDKSIILTMDLDFSYIISLSNENTPSVIIFRLKNETASNINLKLNEIIEKNKKVLASGCIISVKEKFYRIRRLPVK